MGDRGNCLNPTVANEDKECEGHASQENAGIKCGNESLVIIIIIFKKIQRHRTQRQKHNTSYNIAELVIHKIGKEIFFAQN